MTPCDTHVHVFDPERFPYAEGRAYTPPSALLPELRASMANLHAGRCVLVQPSVYGTDNACLLNALGQLGDLARGVAVIDPVLTTDEQLADLHAAGNRAVRVNFEDRQGGAPVDKLAVIAATAERVAGAGLGVQLYVDLATAAEVVDMPCFRDALPILDHFAGFKVGTDIAGPAFGRIIAALSEGRAAVKLSAPYRVGSSDPEFSDLRPAAEAMIAAAPDQIVWASDWPHTGGGADRAMRGPYAIEPFRQIDDAADLRRLRLWAGSETTFASILSTNPARIFDFPAFA